MDAAAVSPSKKNPCGKFIGTGQRKIIVNLYKKIVKHQLENPDSPRMTLRDMIVDISKSSGIGQRSVQNI
ncbi:unnamed protein product [Macrosiphum euphorbiae]|uniref:Uncharacterized protein n=1 Tax=Macrosiphum euphorbiae TaxID=13131 RepID=A0AAV0WKK5_9HEMI|nr:unnamed protein product [Macrosiphum euphorbiae]